MFTGPRKSFFSLIILSSIFVSMTFVFAEGEPGRNEIDSSGIEETVVVSTDSRGNVIVPPASEKAMSYYYSGNILWIIRILLGLIIPALILFSGLSARMRNLAERIGRKWFFIIGVYYFLYLTITTLIDFPIAYYSGYIRPHDYGLSNQTFARWIGNFAKGYGLDLLGGFLFLWIPYLLLKKSPTRWWLYSGILSIPFAFLMLIVTPLWIAPLFNDFGPMKDKGLESKITALAERAGIENSKIYEVDKSRDTDTVNAYVTGFLNTKRIVLWDTTIEKLDEDEILFIMGHEMGHYILNHMVESVFFYSFLTILTLFFVNRFATYIMRKYFYKVKFSDLSDIASLPLLILMMGVFSLILDPISNSYSRKKEKESDKFGLEITRNNHAAASAFVKLQQTNLANPYPGMLYIMWRSSHPPIGKRVEFINDYKPWENGGKTEYDIYFSEP